MSSTCSKLRRIWQTQRSTSSPVTGISRRALGPATDELFKEPDVEVMASKLKVLSADFHFRSKINVYSYAIDRLAKQKRFSTIEDILDAQKKYITKERHASHLILLYGDARMFDHAHKLFDELPDLKCDRGTAAFNSLLMAALHSKEFQRVVEIFHKYPSELALKPDAVSYNTVIRALGELGLLDEALSMIDKMEMEGLKPNLYTFNALLTAAYGGKGFREGEGIWEMMLEKKGDLVPDVKSYNAKLQGMMNDGMVLEAVDLFNELSVKKLKPNVTTYNHLIKGFCDKGDLEEAKKWYMKLVDSVGFPNVDTFDTLIRPLCENGDSVLALDLSKRMLGRYYVVDQDLLQMVVDNLVKDSEVDEALKLVELGRSNVYCQYELVLP